MPSFPVLDVKAAVTGDNDARAAQVRAELDASRTFLVNLMASPGAGKTSTLAATIPLLAGQFRIGVIEADVDSAVDAETLEALGVRVVQLHTGGSCHMDAGMTRKGLEQLNLEELDLVFLENVGNLVCPAEFDVGAQLKAMILSVPEGDDKPLKYPLMFQVSDVMLVNKIDAAPVFDFSLEACEERVRELNPSIEVLPISAKTGEGVEAWAAWLAARVEAWRESL